jgi:hypothetical protein
MRSKDRGFAAETSPCPKCGWENPGSVREYAGARSEVRVRRAGSPIPTNDLWIAALAIQHDLLLYTRDAHFDKLPQIARA